MILEKIKTKYEFKIKQPSEEDPDEGIKDLVEIALKKMVFIKLNLKKGMIKFSRISQYFLQIEFLRK